jgi:hypothetical protein
MSCPDDPAPLTAVTQQLNELLSEFQASVAAARSESRNKRWPASNVAAASAAASSHCCGGGVTTEDSIASSFEDMQGNCLLELLQATGMLAHTEHCRKPLLPGLACARTPI